MFPFIPFRWSILAAITLVCSLSLAILGCAGGGGGGSSPVGAVDHSAITSTLRSFMMAASKGDLNAASQGLSPALRSSAAASSVIATFTFMDFGDDFYDRNDDGSWTFIVRNGGIVALSSDLAEVNAECLSRTGTLIKLFFRMIREQGTWLIDDVQLEGIQNDVVDAVAYFPLAQGNRWEYLEGNSSGNTSLIIRTIASAPEIINGQKVYSIVQTAQPLPPIVPSPPPPAFSGQLRQPANSALFSRPSIAGTIRSLFQSGSSVERFSTNDGLYFYGADSSFNNNSPLEIIALNAVEGETTPSVISVLVGGMRYEADVEILIKSTESFVTPIQTYDAIPVQITVIWRQVPPGETPRQRETWFVAQDVGLIGRQIHDPNNLDQILTSTTLQMAVIDGRTIDGSTSGEPVIQSVFPLPGTTNVSPSTSITADFNHPMDLASLQGGKFTVTISGSPVSGSISVSGNSAFFASLSPLPGNAIVTATIATGTLDQTGKALAAGRTWTFTTAADTAPSFVIGGDQTVLEDAGNQNFANWATSIVVPSGNPVFTVSNNNTALFSVQPAISSTGALSFTPAPNANGQATINVILGSDAPGVTPSAPQTSLITITPVNDPPSFVKGSDVFKIYNAGPQTLANWATSISGGPADESGQTVSFTVTANAPLAFTTQPTLDSNGTLSFSPDAPAVSLNGFFNNIITITAIDNGGTANGGVNSSTAQTFNLMLTWDTLSLVSSIPAVSTPVATDTVIILRFDQPVDLIDLASKLTVTYTGPPNMVSYTVADFSQIGNTVYLTPPGGLLVVGTAILDIQAGLQSISGAPLTAALAVSFDIVPTNNPSISTPSISAPLANASSVGLTPTFGGSTFIALGGYIHTATDWEVFESATISASNRIWCGLGAGGAYLSSIMVNDGPGAFENSHLGRTALKPGTDYWVRVRYYADDNNGFPVGASQWSAFVKFTTSFPPDAPIITTPIPTGLNPTISASAFSDPDAGDSMNDSNWEIYENPDTSISSNQIWASNVGAVESVVVNGSSGFFMNSHSTLPDTNLRSGVTYYVRVQYVDSANVPSPWSNLIAFTASGIASPF